MKGIPVIVLAVGLAGCATQPVGPQNRADWQKLHTHELHGVTQDQALAAAEQVLKIDDHDFTFDYPPGQLVAQRRWLVYVVLAAASGIDYWHITTSPVADGVTMTVQISRQAGVIAPSPTVNSAGINGVGVNSTTMPGTSIAAPFPYNLFWARLEYLLGKSTAWVTCDQAKAGKTGRQKMGNDTLCGVTTDDDTPTADMVLDVPLSASQATAG